MLSHPNTDLEDFGMRKYHEIITIRILIHGKFSQKYVRISEYPFGLINGKNYIWLLPLEPSDGPKYVLFSRYHQ